MFTPFLTEKNIVDHEEDKLNDESNGTHDDESEGALLSDDHEF